MKGSGLSCIVPSSLSTPGTSEKPRSVKGIRPCVARVWRILIAFVPRGMASRRAISGRHPECATFENRHRCDGARHCKGGVMSNCTEACQPYCNLHTQLWSKKCAWDVCLGCSDCLDVKRQATCTECTDRRTHYMEENDKVCDQYPYAYRNLCKHDANWVRRKFCQRSCFENGAGYGDMCCLAAAPPVTCTECTNERNTYMEETDKVCDQFPYAYRNRCKHDDYWVKRKFCQRSCFDNGAGYEGDVCCPPPSPPPLPPLPPPSPPLPPSPPSPPSSPPACTECTDEPNAYILENNLACNQYPYAYTRLCTGTTPTGPSRSSASARALRMG